jgi:hypothetical protein
VKQILAGARPSDEFKELLRDRPALTTGDLALEFQQYGYL